MTSRKGSTGEAIANLIDNGDAALLAASARGDAVAFRELVDRYYRPVYRLVWRMTSGHADSEDIAQEAFVKLWRDPRQVREGAALKGWLMRVASNAVIDRSRKRVHADIDGAIEIADPKAVASAPLDQRQASKLVDSRIALLPGRQRQVLSLVYFEGLSNIEAAAVMETTVEAVESLLGRARRSLKESLASEWRDLLDGLTAPGL